VLAEVGADKLPELLVVNKVDAASEETLLRLKREWPDAVFVSARTGSGIEQLQEAIEARLPRPAVEMSVLFPYDRGDLVARVHRRGEVLETEHRDGGTFMRVRVSEMLAANLAKYLVTVSSTGAHPQ
jgi:GTP-binding protein HflX